MAEHSMLDDSVLTRNCRKVALIVSPTRKVIDRSPLLSLSTVMKRCVFRDLN